MMDRLQGLPAKQKPRRICSIYSLSEHNGDPPHLSNTLSCPAWNSQQRGARSKMQDEETRMNGREWKGGKRGECCPEKGPIRTLGAEPELRQEGPVLQAAGRGRQRASPTSRASDNTQQGGSPGGGVRAPFVPKAPNRGFSIVSPSSDVTRVRQGQRDTWGVGSAAGRRE